MDQMACLIEEV